ncbi:hypothetical protein [Rhodoligotrophos defluvii]|uniref:hypothetical protein n=1 Tax=Rhodoligotrophos defluvii TaxID=2561934 RepID=UPI0010C9BA9A|nr:hypothetical protein [Rhodoligotrophos defluvii]
MQASLMPARRPLAAWGWAALCLLLVLLDASAARADFQAGIRDARDECVRRAGQFWTTSLGYGCNNTRELGDFRCQAGICATGYAAVRRPGDFSAPLGNTRGPNPGH